MPTNPDMGPTLFDDIDAPLPVEEDLDAKIARIGAQPSKRLASDDKLSAVQAEVTGVQTAWDEALASDTTPTRATETTRRKPYELPGKDGRTNQLPNLQPHEAQAGMTDEDVDAQNEINKLGAAAAKEILKRSLGN